MSAGDPRKAETVRPDGKRESLPTSGVSRAQRSWETDAKTSVGSAHSSRYRIRAPAKSWEADGETVQRPAEQPLPEAAFRDDSVPISLSRRRAVPNSGPWMSAGARSAAQAASSQQPASQPEPSSPLASAEPGREENRRSEAARGRASGRARAWLWAVPVVLLTAGVALAIARSRGALDPSALARWLGLS